MPAIYLDQAATSFPKPPCVAARMAEYLTQVGANVNRSVYGAAQQAELVTLRLRQRLCELLDFADPTHVVLTPGNTWGLNLVLGGRCTPATTASCREWSITPSCGLCSGWQNRG